MASFLTRVQDITIFWTEGPFWWTWEKFRDEIDILQNLGTILADACKFKDEVDNSLNF